MTSSLVKGSVIAFFESCTAARAMIPTVAALIPERRAYAGPGSVSPIFCTPRDRPYIATVPGKDHRKKTKRAGIIPAWICAILNNIFVDAGPGRACDRANNS